MQRTATYLLFTLFAATAIAQDGKAQTATEKPVKSRIASIGLFKNGLAIVERRLAIDGAGVYRIDDVPEPVHGTFWVESSAKIVTRLTRRVVDVPVQSLASTATFNSIEELAGRDVVWCISPSRICLRHREECWPWPLGTAPMLGIGRISNRDTTIRLSVRAARKRRTECWSWQVNRAARTSTPRRLPTSRRKVRLKRSSNVSP